MSQVVDLLTFLEHYTVLFISLVHISFTQNFPCQAFTEAATGSSAAFQRDLAPFMILNSLGLTVSVLPSDSFNVLNVPMAKSYELKNEESLSMDYVRTKDSDHFNAMTSLSSKLFFILLSK